MNCDVVRHELVDYLDGRCGPIKRFRVRRHLERCEACVLALREDEALIARLAVLEDEAPAEAVWLRIRDSVAAAGLPETIPPTWWERIRAGTLRYAMPYALGVATTALLIMAGLGRSESPVVPAGDTDGPRSPFVVAQDPEPTGGEWLPFVGGPASLRPGEAPLVVENGLVIRERSDDDDYRRMLESLRRRGVNPEDLEEVPATPVSFDKKTH